MISSICQSSKKSQSTAGTETPFDEKPLLYEVKFNTNTEFQVLKFIYHLPISTDLVATEISSISTFLDTDMIPISLNPCTTVLLEGTVS